jgi:hypothetical protein
VYAECAASFYRASQLGRPRCKLRQYDIWLLPRAVHTYHVTVISKACLPKMIWGND